ncbi:MAG TPA: nickel pincer cofactor biosynthesis protein LarC [Terriglobia bacterium]|nr:nickel pincer cofactor biosynthesis protein LarC [Terriglobia bacterium]
MAKSAYLECSSGISGDMCLAALIDAGVSADGLLRELRKIPIGEFDFKVSRVSRSGITATHVEITSPEKQPERHLHHIEKILAASELPPTVREKAALIFRRLAEVEGAIHGKPPQSIHFHEVGAVDAVLDIAGACLGFEMLEIDELRCSALNVGSGRVQAAHGSLPVPAPATAELLKGAPVYSSGIEAELVTPTGAAIVTAFAKSFGPMPPLKVECIGYGAGTRDFPGHPNVVRLFLGESLMASEAAAGGEIVSVIEADVDDMSPQLYGYLAERAFAVGALDVTCGSVQMKKNRLGLHISILCLPERAEALAALVFEQTTTIGLRIHEARRKTLAREWATVETPHGAVRMKVASCNGRVMNVAPEYEDCRRLAEEKAVPLKQVMVDALAAYQARK